MNLHIVPDNVFINKLYENLAELDILQHNRIVVRTNHATLRTLKHPLPFAKLYTSRFEQLTEDTSEYAKVFIHFFSPLLYRWVATHSFRELGWMVWGADLYNLPCIHAQLYEKLTWEKYIRRSFSMNDLLYRMKVRVIHEPYRARAYAMVTDVLTWMQSEFDFARQHIPALKADHRFFFYENSLPYQALNDILQQESVPRRNRPVYILGNSATPELNHLDAVALMEEAGVNADLCVPVSYGDMRYARFLKRNLAHHRGGDIRFINQHMPFGEYVQFLNQCDGLIMNNIRPQGYGNIFMMMYLGKKVFLNPRNPSTADLDRAGLRWEPVAHAGNTSTIEWEANRSAVTAFLSHERCLRVYNELFS